MAKGYIIARLEVSDPTQFQKYITAAAKAIEEHSVNVLVRGGKSTVLEGEGRQRNVVLEFESFDLAINYYNSTEYQAARLLRNGIANADIVVVEGV